MVVVELVVEHRFVVGHMRVVVEVDTLLVEYMVLEQVQASLEEVWQASLGEVPQVHSYQEFDRES